MGYNSAVDDRELTRQIKKGQMQAFDQLYKRYSQNLYRFARSMLKTHEDAEEVVQEVFFRLWNKRHGLSEDKSIQSYLFTIVRHVTIDLLRQRLKNQDFEQFLVKEVQKNYSDSASALEYKELKQQVEEAVNELPKKRRNIYQLSRKKGLSNKEIALKENISVKTVEAHMTLALRHIRDKLERSGINTLIFICLFL